jgi:DnaJ-class molecular chaperone
MCGTCIGYGVVVRIWREDKTMRIKNLPCPSCEGRGTLQGTQQVEADEDDD